MPRVVRVARACGMLEGEFARLRLSENDGARGTQAGDAFGIDARTMAAIDRRVVLRRHVGRVDDVLDADRNAVKWPERPPHAVALPCLVDRVIRIQERPR